MKYSLYGQCFYHIFSDLASFCDKNYKYDFQTYKSFLSCLFYNRFDTFYLLTIDSL